MRRVPPPPYRDFYYPLNVFMHILSHEEPAVPYLHYGLFADPNDALRTAQERSTQLLRERLPPPPAKLLDVGAGLGTTLASLASSGYEMHGITPDDKQIAMIRARYDAAGVTCMRYEDLPPEPFDAIYFQESSQYIAASDVFAKAEQMTSRVVVLDEFALRPVDVAGALHSLAGFLDAATGHGFRAIEEVDLTEAAAPTIDYFNARLARYREPLVRDLGITDAQVDELIANGVRYRELYRNGSYGYRLLQFRRG
jgi:hypothetical protein